MKKYLLQRTGYCPTADFVAGQYLPNTENGEIYLLQIKPGVSTGNITVKYPSGQNEAFDLSIEDGDSINSNPIQVIQIVSTDLTINQDFYLYK